MYWKLSSAFLRVPWPALLQLFNFTLYLFQHPWLSSTLPSEWFHWAKKLEDQMLSGVIAEIQHLSKKYYSFWVSLWYLDVYITPDTDWMTLKSGFPSHSSLLHHICLIATLMKCNSCKKSCVCSCALSFEVLWKLL